MGRGRGPGPLRSGPDGRDAALRRDPGQRGQDFATAWLDTLDELLREGRESHFAGFPDAPQDLFERAESLPFHYRLRFNLRNTRRIADAVRRLGAVEMSRHPRAPDGEPNSVHSTTRVGKIVKEWEAPIRRLLEQEGVRPERIVILPPRSWKNSSLRGVESLAGIPLGDDPNQRTGRLLHTTIRSFKGLESDVLVLIDVDPSYERCTKLDRYVAASRARGVTHVLALDCHPCPGTGPTRRHTTADPAPNSTVASTGLPSRTTLPSAIRKSKSVPLQKSLTTLPSSML